MLNTDHLQTFLAVTETGSYTAAATRLGFTQPAVSQHIKALETQVGEVRLFRRVGKRMRLTHAGEELLGFARELIASAERAEQHMLGLRGHIVGRIGLGCAPSSGERVLPALLAAFHSRHPGVQFAVDVGPAEQLLGWLANGQVQAALLDEHPRRRTYDVLELGGEEIAVVVGRTQPLARSGRLGRAVGTAARLELAELGGMPLILPHRGMALRRLVEDLFRRHGISAGQLDVVLETDSAAAALQAAADGLGAAIVPRSRVVKARRLAELQVDGLLPQSWFLVRPRGGSASRAVDELWSFASSDESRRVFSGLGLEEPPPAAQ